MKTEQTIVNEMVVFALVQALVLTLARMHAGGPQEGVKLILDQAKLVVDRAALTGVPPEKLAELHQLARATLDQWFKIDADAFDHLA